MARHFFFNWPQYTAALVIPTLSLVSGCLSQEEGGSAPLSDWAAAESEELNSFDIGTAKSAAEVNLLSNGDFTAGANSWITRLTAPATGAITFATGTAKFGINTAGTQNYHVQLYQNIQVAAGTLYNYSFAARKASAGTRNINFVVESDVTPFTKDVNRQISIDGTLRTFTGSFTASSSRLVRIEIQAGLSDLDLEADSFSVSVAGPVIDTTPPTVSFSAPATNVSRTVPLTLTATDNVAVTGYYLTSWLAGAPALNTPPAASDPGWVTSRPTSFTAPISAGCVTLAVYAKDAEGNVSARRTANSCIVDTFEGDDTSATAKNISVDAAPQARSSHSNANFDWAMFNVEEGRTYTVSAVHSTPYQSDTGKAILALFDSHRLSTPFLEQAEAAPGGASPTQIKFVAGYTGTYYVRYRGRTVDLASAAEAYTLSVNAEAAAEALSNRSFSSGGNSWVQSFTAPATGSVTFTNGVAHFGINTAGTVNSAAQLYQVVPVQEGTLYKYSFSARKSSAGTRTARFVVARDSAPLEVEVNRQVSLDATTRTFSGTFTATATRNVRVGIQGGASDLDFDVDDFSISEREPTCDVGAFLGNPTGFEQSVDVNLNFRLLFQRYNELDFAPVKTLLDQGLDVAVNIEFLDSGSVLRKVTAGNYDGRLNTFINALNADGRFVWIRTLHEMNGNWYPWGVADESTQTTTDFKNAWIHVVNLFRSRGANVKFQLAYNRVTVSGNPDVPPLPYSAFYPGDRYVDIVLASAYNRSGMDGSPWRTFREAFGPSYAQIVGITNKPVGIGETSSSPYVDDNGVGGDKAGWFIDAFDALTTDYPRVQFSNFFFINKQVGDEGRERRWDLNTTAEREAFEQGFWDYKRLCLQR